MLQSRLRLPAVVALALALAGCGTAAPAAPKPAARPATKAAPSASAKPPSATPASAKPALKPVTLQLAWLVSGYHAPLFLALERGYYKQAGLKVKVAPGLGGNLAVNLVAKGGPIFSALSASAAMLPIAKGVPVKVIAVYDHESPTSLFYHAAYPLKTAQDLKGKTIYYQASAVSYQMFPAVLAAQGMTEKGLAMRNVSAQEFPALFKRNPKAVEIGFDNSDYLRVLASNPDARYRLYSAWGVNLYDMGLITNDQMIKQHPNEVRAFVAATSKGWAAALKDPKAAVAATVKYDPQVNPKVIAAGLKLTLAQMASPAGHPLGWMSASAWQKQLGLLRKYAGMKGNTPLSAFYTNGFVTGG